MKRNNIVPRCAGLLVVAIALLLFPGLHLPAAVPAAMEGTATNVDRQAVILLERMGHYDEAEAGCLRILERNPNDPAVKDLLHEIQERKQEQNRSTDLARNVDEIVIPELNVRDASVADVVDILQADSKARSGDKAPINFVWQAPEESRIAKVTLNLRSVPLGDALKYVLESAGLRYRVDPHAIVIYKPPSPKEPSPSNVKPQ
jgi:hypothetical protein